MPSYIAWNDTLVRHFFSEQNAGKPVWLYVTTETIHDVGGHMGGFDVADFVEAVRQGPHWATAGGVCQRALQTLDGWRLRDLEYPPYVAYLALFVLAAGLEGDFATHAYYPRLRSLLDESGDGPLPSFDKMLALWDDLETWSTQDRLGELGIFVVRLVGEWIHVGVPIAQTVLSEKERKSLPAVFASAGIDPTSVPSDEELARALRNARDVMRPRTIRLLESGEDADAYSALLDAALEELCNWNGELADGSELADRIPRRVLGSMRLCMSYDATAGIANLMCRATLRATFPDNGLELETSSFDTILLCEESVPGWSSPLRVAGSENRFDASLLNWSTGADFSDAALAVEFKLLPRDVRILTDGRAEGLPGLVETLNLQPNQPLYLLFLSARWPSLRPWAEQECDNFRIREVRSGLPEGWCFASCDAAKSDRHVRDGFPQLTITPRVRGTFVRGLRSLAGSSFFALAPPNLRLDGGLGTEVVVCEGKCLSPIRGTREYQLPRDLPVGKRITIEIQRDGRTRRSVSLYLTSDSNWRRTKPMVLLDKWGEVADGPEGIAGAHITGLTPTVDTFGFTPESVLSARSRQKERIIFLGRKPGQVVRWPSEPLCGSWSPVWALEMGRKRGKAVFCGQSLGLLPVMDDRPAFQNRAREWKKYLWRWRKRITPPRSKELRTLWRAYLEAASAG